MASEWATEYSGLEESETGRLEPNEKRTEEHALGPERLHVLACRIR